MLLQESIRTLRQQRGISQEELAEHMGVSRQAVGKWESGASYPDTEHLLALAEFFAVSVDELAGQIVEVWPREDAALPQNAVDDIADSAGISANSAGISANSAGISANSAAEDAAAEAVNNYKWKKTLIWIIAITLMLLAVGLPLLVILGNMAKDDGSVTLPAIDRTGEFALCWQTEDEWEYLALGTQEELFPFGTTLEPSGMEQVLDTDFRSLKLHNVSCGDLNISYTRFTEEQITDSLSAMSTIRSGYFTPRGVQVGSDAASVVELYGDQLVYALKESGPDVLCLHEYIYAYAEPGGISIAFYINGGHVAGLSLLAGSDGYNPYEVNNISVFPMRDGQPDFSQRQQPELEPVDATRAVFIALYALQTDANVSAQEQWQYRQSIYNNLQYLDWQAYGMLGEAGAETQTQQELLSWLQKQDEFSHDELLGLQLGAVRSNVDGWIADSYCNALADAFVSYPLDYVQLACGDDFNEQERQSLQVLTAYGCSVPDDRCRQALSAVEEILRSGMMDTDAKSSFVQELQQQLEDWQ